MRNFVRLFFFLFSFSNLIVFANDYESLDLLYSRGLDLFDKNEFTGSLWELNKAMGRLKHNSNHPLYPKVSKAIRMTKAKIALQRAQKKILRSDFLNNELGTLESEGKDFFINQSYGKSVARKVWGNRDSLNESTYLGQGRTVTVLPDGGVELTEARNNLFGLRCVEAGSFTLRTQDIIDLHSGSYMIHTFKPEHSIELNSVFAKIRIYSDAPFVFLANVTTSGGLKLISLLGRIHLVAESNKQELIPGELVFLSQNEFSRKMNVELSTLIVTAKLLNGFPKPSSFLPKLRQQAIIQSLRSEKRFRTSVGDLKGNQNFELKLLPD